MLLAIFEDTTHRRAGQLVKVQGQAGSHFLKTRLKRLPVISREHFRKTRTNYFYKHLKYQSAKWNLKY
jgi:hypothetical protein